MHKSRQCPMLYGIIFIGILSFNLGVGLYFQSGLNFTESSQDSRNAVISAPNNLEDQFDTIKKYSTREDSIFNEDPSGENETDLPTPRPQSPPELPRSTRPTTGEVSVLGMPVYFADQGYSHPVSDFTTMWNSESGSVQSYYLENSFDKLEFTLTIKDWVMMYASVDSFSDSDGDQNSEMDLFNFIVDYWEASTDFAQYDYLMIIYAGSSTYDATARFNFWPHVNWNTVFETDEMVYDRCAFLGETSSMGTHCHEFGHMLGLLDYYMRDLTDPQQPTLPIFPCGVWEIMDRGGHNTYPSHLSLYSKTILNWVEPADLYSIEEGEITNFHIVPLEQSYTDPANGYYLGAVYNAPDNYQYYLEYRADIGTDVALPDHGLLISRYDYTKGQYEGPLWYIGGNNDISSLGNPELQDADTDNSERFLHWLTDSITLSTAVLTEIPEAGEVPKNLEVIVDTLHDFGDDWNEKTDVKKDETEYWYFNNQEVNDMIYFCWDTDSALASSNFNFQQKVDATWQTLVSKPNIFQDAFKYRVLTAGDYRIGIENENNLFAIDIQYFLQEYAAPVYNVTWDLPTTVYQIGGIAEFEVFVELSNTQQGWIPYPDSIAGILEIALPGTLLKVEEVGNFLDAPSAPLFYNHPKTATYRLTTTALGSQVLNLTFANVGISTQLTRSVMVLEDLIDPTILLDSSDPGTNLENYHLSWDASDQETGIDRYEFYVNGSLALIKNDTGFAQDIPIPEVEGQYEITVVVFDRVNNSATASTMIWVDRTSPILIVEEISFSASVFQFMLSFNETMSFPLQLKLTINDQLFVDAFLNQSQISGYTLQISLTDLEDLGVLQPSEVLFQFIIYDSLGNSDVRYYSPPPEPPRFKVIPTDNAEGRLIFELEPSLFADKFYVYYADQAFSDTTGNVTLVDSFSSYNYSQPVSISGTYYVAVMARNRLGKAFTDAIQITITQPESDPKPKIPGYPVLLVMLGAIISILGIRNFVHRKHTWTQFSST